ncbi:alpha/beta hydrolase [Streptomyces sp. NPDC088551]|uniref:alpha/beta hydrolase n=3 Tax=unclassified Streptomyces TaxID=2593676 RepID=UPI00382BACB9
MRARTGQPAGPEMARTEDVETGPTGSRFRLRILIPHGNPPAVIVYYHGGGWVLGEPADVEPLGRALARRSGCAVVLVDYRLAPEHPHPAAVDDACAALRWAAAHRAEIAGRDVPVIVAGDSAGGNLAAVAAQRARDDGAPPLALQILVYPATDCDLETRSYRAPENQLLLSRDLMIRFWDSYLPDTASRTAPTASPLRAADLSGLAPAEIITAEYDVLRDEGEAYAERLREAGVPVGLRRFEGQMHGFFTMTGLLPGSDRALDHIVERIHARLSQRTIRTAGTPPRSRLHSPTATATTEGGHSDVR